MKQGVLTILLVFFIVSSCNTEKKPALAPQIPVIDNYFGVEVEDPYRYMENMDDTIFLSWMKQYAEYSRKLLDEIPGRNGLLEMMFDFDTRKSDKVYWPTVTRSGRYIYQKISAEEEKTKLYYRDSFSSTEQLLYDPDTYSSDTTLNYTINGVYPDQEGNQVALSLSPNGSEAGELIMLSVKEGRINREVLKQVFGSVSWVNENAGFLYGKTNSPDVHDAERYLDTKVFYHEVGTDQEDDLLMFSSADYPNVGMNPREIPYIIYDNESGNYFLLLYTVERYLKSFVAKGENLRSGHRFKWKPLTNSDDKIVRFGVIGDDLYFMTSKEAPGYTIKRTKLFQPDYINAEVIVPEPESGVVSSFTFTKDAMYYSIIYNGVEEKLYAANLKSGELSEITLPVKAGKLELSNRGLDFEELWVEIRGWTQDRIRYKYNSDGSFVPEELSSSAKYPEFKDLVVEELMVPSHDGTLVPLSLIYKRGLILDGTAPVMLYGYGAYGKSIAPGFSPYSLLWTLKNGIYAVAHVRGGGELGDEWRLGGHKSKKPNTWKDMIACAEYLVEENYTSPKHIAIRGGSAGGILIGRAMTERPDLFAAAIPVVGSMNPIRSEQSPNGPVNAPEFGTVKDSVECFGLLEMDAYQNVVDGTSYPATLIVAGFNDPRVIVWQPAKFAARLQSANSSKKPILFKVDYSSGHGIGDTKTKSFEDLADQFAFALWQTGHPEFQK